VSPAFDPESIVNDAVQTAKTQISTAGLFGVALLALVAVVVFAPSKKRR
jgi:hypothetical protein